MLSHIVGRLHVGASARDVIREVRQALQRSALNRKHRDTRHEMYREALKLHKANRDLYSDVMSGRLG